MKMKKLIIAFCIMSGLVLFVSNTALAVDTVYVDLSGIDGIAGMSAADKNSLKSYILDDMRQNFGVALGTGNVSITSDPAKKATANRRVFIKDALGTHTRKNGTTGYHYGEWTGGGKDANIYVKNFTVRHGADYKTGGKWDLWKLRNGIGRSAAHEIGHSYSVGHNGKGASPSKMTRGGLVTSATRATTNWRFDKHTNKVIKKNLGRMPCKTVTDYEKDFLQPIFYEAPSFPDDLDEYGNFDATFQFSGPLAGDFDLGWYGEDSDVDEDSDFDFIYKTSMEGVTGEDAEMLTFFEEAHSGVQFVLLCQEGTSFEGQWFSMSEANIIPSDFVTTPDGTYIFRYLNISWDINPGLTGFEVMISLNAANVYSPYGAEYNGWQLIPEPATICLLGLGGLALLRRRRG